MTGPYIDPYYNLCLTCPLPECDEQSSRCPRRRRIAGNELAIEGCMTTVQAAVFLQLARPTVQTFLERYKDEMGAYKQRLRPNGRTNWVIPEQGVRWLALHLGRDYLLEGLEAQ